MLGGVAVSRGVGGPPLPGRGVASGRTSSVSAVFSGGTGRGGPGTILGAEGTGALDFSLIEGEESEAFEAFVGESVGELLTLGLLSGGTVFSGAGNGALDLSASVCAGAGAGAAGGSAAAGATGGGAGAFPFPRAFSAPSLFRA